jgi:hypothetical protein
LEVLTVNADRMTPHSRLVASVLALATLGGGWVVFASRAHATAIGYVAPMSEIVVIAEFDPPDQNWLTGHRGVDLAASSGQTVRSAGAGVVTYVGSIAGKAVVTVSHGELRTTYEPVDAIVSRGERVAAGEMLGTIGVGGHCSARCLHWGLLRGDEYLNPLWLLDSGPPILKPLEGASAPEGATTRLRVLDSTVDAPVIPAVVGGGIAVVGATAAGAGYGIARRRRR